MSWKITEALTSVRRLREMIPELTEAEVLAALKLEQGSRRRKHVISPLQKAASNFYHLSLSKE